MPVTALSWPLFRLKPSATAATRSVARMTMDMLARTLVLLLRPFFSFLLVDWTALDSRRCAPQLGQNLPYVLTAPHL